MRWHFGVLGAYDRRSSSTLSAPVAGGRDAAATARSDYSRGARRRGVIRICRGSTRTQMRTARRWSSRPDLAGKRLEDFGDKEWRPCARDRQKRAQAGAGRIGGSAGRRHRRVGRRTGHEHLQANNSQPWLVVRSAEREAFRRITAAARQRAAGASGPRARARGPADSLDRTAASTIAASPAGCRAR